jgi:hypothetical protein
MMAKLEKYTMYGIGHRLSINRPTKRGKENSRSDGECLFYGIDTSRDKSRDYELVSVTS